MRFARRTSSRLSVAMLDAGGQSHPEEDCVSDQTYDRDDGRRGDYDTERLKQNTPPIL
jgi:hypothetical protein